MNQKSVGLTLRAVFLALALILVAGPALPLFDGVAYAQQSLAKPALVGNTTPGNDAVSLSWGVVSGATGYQVVKQDRAVGTWSDPISVDTNSYTDSPVSAGKTYGYYVRAVAVTTDGTTEVTTEGPWSDYLEVVIPGGIAAPTGQPRLDADPSGTDAVDLSWTAVTGAATYQLIRWNPATSNWDTIGGDSLSGTTYSDTGLAAGTYHYAVRAVNAGGNGPWSSENVGYATVVLDATTAVPVLSLAHDERGVIELSWTAVAGAPTYELDRRKSTGGWVSVELDDSSATSHTDNISDAGTYYYRVRAVVNDAEGPWSNEKRTIVPESGRRPGTPTITSATATGSTTIVIEWSVSSPDTASSYTLQWKSGSQDWSTSRQRKPSAKSYTLDGLRAGVEYTFRVQAANVNGPSEWSGEKSATTFASAVTHIDGRLGPPQGLKVVDESKVGADGVINRKLKVSWNSVRDATHYQVYKWNSVGGAFDWRPEAFVTTTSHEDDIDGATDLDPGMTYYYVVRALADPDAVADAVNPTNDAVYGEWSNYAMGTTMAYKPAKPALSAEVRGGNAIWLAWTSAAADSDDQVGATTGYQLQYRTSGSGASWTTFRDLGDGMKSYFHQNLRSSRTYFYKVRGMNNSGYGSWSEVQEKKIPSQTKPATPTGVVVTDASTYDGSSLVPTLKVSWNKVEGATGYQVQGWARITSDDGVEWMWRPVAASPTDKTSVTVTTLNRDETLDEAQRTRSLEEGTTYFFVVRAMNEGIAGDWSASAYGTTKQTVPDAPSLIAVTVGEKMVRLSWTAVSGATSYQLGFIKVVGALAADARRPEHYTVIPVDGMHFTHSGRTAGTAYDYRVRAVLPAGVFTDWSTVAPATTRPARPAKFNAEAAVAGTTHTVVLTWKKVTYDNAATSAAGDPAAYQVQFRESGDAWADVESPAACVEDSDDDTLCTVTHSTGVEDRTRYFYRLRAQGGTAADTFGYWVMTDETTKADADE